MQNNEQARVLPADVYDTLELSAEAYGGIGANKFYEHEYDNSVGAPCCVWGHAYAAGTTSGERYWVGSDITIALDNVNIGAGDNDRAVSAINTRKGNAPGARVTFAEWAKELNVVRGD